MKQKTLIVVVLDETGSMSSVRDQTISGFNEFLDSQEDKALGETKVTLVQFNSDRIAIPYSDKLIEDVPKLTRDEYKPDSTTPLYDAVARAIKDTEGKYKTEKEVLERLSGHKVKNYGPLVIMVVMTDGLENASTEYTREKVFRMISDKKSDGWAFVFMGSNQDSWASAQPLGFDQGAIANYGQPRKAFAGVGHATAAYRAMAQSIATDASDLEDYKKQLTAVRANYWQGKESADDFDEKSIQQIKGGK